MAITFPANQGSQGLVSEASGALNFPPRSPFPQPTIKTVLKPIAISSRQKNFSISQKLTYTIDI